MTADINSIRKIWSTPAKFKFSIRIRYKLSHLVIQTSSRNHSIPRTALCLFHTSCMGNHHQSTTFVLIAHSTPSISHIMHGQPPPIHDFCSHRAQHSVYFTHHAWATTTNPRLSFSSRTALSLFHTSCMGNHHQSTFVSSRTTLSLFHTSCMAGQPPPIHFRSHRAQHSVYFTHHAWATTTNPRLSFSQHSLPCFRI